MDDKGLSYVVRYRITLLKLALAVIHYRGNMSSLLPDVALDQPSSIHRALDGVGMQGIDLPLMVEGVGFPIAAKANVQVNLPNPMAKGIHMSRLYRLLDTLAEGTTPLAPPTLQVLLQAMVESHHDCQTTQASLRLGFELLYRRPALATPGLSGWKAYPVTLEASWAAGMFKLLASVEVTYSSTCPCSAALSRQLLEQAFRRRFGAAQALQPEVVAQWLREHGSVATPHSQRSVARVRVVVDPQASALGLGELIERVENALGTPVQTAVKRADEQAFAALNGANLMYVEDAARKVQQALAASYAHSSVSVKHMESLHPHDAVATDSTMLLAL